MSQKNDGLQSPVSLVAKTAVALVTVSLVLALAVVGIGYLAR